MQLQLPSLYIIAIYGPHMYIKYKHKALINHHKCIMDVTKQEDEVL